MTVNIEDYIPVVKHNGLNTDKAVDLDSTLNVAGAATLQSTLAVTGAITATGGVTGAVDASTGGVQVVQAVDNVGNTTPSDAELDSAFGTPATLGRGFIGTVDDADGDTNGFICWTSDASWYFIKGTKAS